MSYDPNDNDPRESRRAREGFDDFAEPRPDPAAAKAKVGVPGTFLLVCGFLNLLAALGYAGFAGYIGMQDADKMKADQVNALQDARDNAKKIEGEGAFKKLIIESSEKALNDLQARDASGLKFQAVA